MATAGVTIGLSVALFFAVAAAVTLAILYALCTTDDVSPSVTVTAGEEIAAGRVLSNAVFPFPFPGLAIDIPVPRNLNFNTLVGQVLPELERIVDSSETSVSQQTITLKQCAAIQSEWQALTSTDYLKCFIVGFSGNKDEWRIIAEKPLGSPGVGDLAIVLYESKTDSSTGTVTWTETLIEQFSTITTSGMSPVMTLVDTINVASFLCSVSFDGTPNKIFYFTEDTAGTWTRVEVGETDTDNNIAFHKSGADFLVINTTTTAVNSFFSQDDGMTWSPLNQITTDVGTWCSLLQQGNGNLTLLYDTAGTTLKTKTLVGFPSNSTTWSNEPDLDLGSVASLLAIRVGEEIILTYSEATPTTVINVKVLDSLETTTVRQETSFSIPNIGPDELDVTSLGFSDGYIIATWGMNRNANLAKNVGYFTLRLANIIDPPVFNILFSQPFIVGQFHDLWSALGQDGAGNQVVVFAICNETSLLRNIVNGRFVNLKNTVNLDWFALQQESNSVF